MPFEQFVIFCWLRFRTRFHTRVDIVVISSSPVLKFYSGGGNNGPNELF